MQKIINALIKLEKYISQTAYKGYDPYDLQYSPITKYIRSNKILFILTQINKRSPVNLRRVLHIKKAYVPKGIALALSGYCNLYNSGLFDNDELKYKIEKIKDILISMILPGFHGPCWGLPFPYANRSSNQPENIPSSVVTHFAQKALLDYYHIFPDESIKSIIIKSADFVLKDLIKTEKEYGICYSYTPLKKDMVFNANGHAAEILLRSYSLTKNQEYFDYAKSCIDFIIHHQKKDGEWLYNINEQGKEKNQIDFHQGFILESINEFLKHLPKREDGIDNIHAALDKGIRFYKNNLFVLSGQSLWRYQKKWPIDIHNQAMGIITFSKFDDHYVAYLNFARTIAEYTIGKMQKKNGSFIYQKWPLISNKIEYYRWGQAWIFYALTTYVRKTSEMNYVK